MVVFVPSLFFPSFVIFPGPHAVPVERWDGAGFLAALGDDWALVADGDGGADVPFVVGEPDVGVVVPAFRLIHPFP